MNPPAAQANLEKNANKAVKTANNAEKKITKNKEDQIKNRINAIVNGLKKETSAEKKAFEQIQLFGRARETFVTRQILGAEAGQVGEKMAKAAATAATGGRKGRVLNIGRVELPNVQDVESFVTEIDRMSEASGISIGAEN